MRYSRWRQGGIDYFWSFHSALHATVSQQSKQANQTCNIPNSHSKQTIPKKVQEKSQNMPNVFIMPLRFIWRLQCHFSMLQEQTRPSKVNDQYDHDQYDRDKKTPKSRDGHVIFMNRKSFIFCPEKYLPFAWKVLFWFCMKSCAEIWFSTEPILCNINSTDVGQKLQSDIQDILTGTCQFTFYSLSSELCSLVYCLLEKPLGNGSDSKNKV